MTVMVRGWAWELREGMAAGVWGGSQARLRWSLMGFPTLYTCRS